MFVKSTGGLVPSASRHWVCLNETLEPQSSIIYVSNFPLGSVKYIMKNKPNKEQLPNCSLGTVTIVLNLFHWVIFSLLNSKLLGNSFITQQCLSKNIAYVFPSWHCVNTHLSAADQQTFIDVSTPADIQVIEGWCSAAPGCNIPLKSYGSSRCVLTNVHVCSFSLWLYFC